MIKSTKKRYKDSKSHFKCQLNDRKWSKPIQNVKINWIFDLFQPFSDGFEYNELIFNKFLIKSIFFQTSQLKSDLF